MTAPVPTSSELARLEVELEVLPQLMHLVAAAARDTGPCALRFLSVTQLRVLKRVALGPRLVTDLAEELGLTPPTVSAAIDSLVRRGLVERGETARDRRVVPLQLTAEGERCVQAVREKVVSAFAEILDQMEPEERGALQRGFRALARVLASHPSSALFLRSRSTDSPTPQLGTM